VIGVINNEMYDMLQQDQERQLLMDLETFTKVKFKNIVCKEILVGQDIDIQETMLKIER